MCLYHDNSRHLEWYKKHPHKQQVHKFSFINNTFHNRGISKHTLAQNPQYLVLKSSGQTFRHFEALPISEWHYKRLNKFTYCMQAVTDFLWWMTRLDVHILSCFFCCWMKIYWWHQNYNRNVGGCIPSTYCTFPNENQPHSGTKVFKVYNLPDYILHNKHCHVRRTSSLRYAYALPKPLKSVTKMLPLIYWLRRIWMM